MYKNSNFEAKKAISATPVDYLNHFKLWLHSQGFNDTTIRNYSADVNKYLSTTPVTEIFSQSRISAYIRLLSTEKNGQRYLASFNKFCQFAKDQKLMANDAVKKNIDLSNLNTEIEQYQSYLVKKNKSPKTVQNYINDIQHFINWLETS